VHSPLFLIVVLNPRKPTGELSCAASRPPTPPDF
jgi:hypothetical protein